MLNRLKKLERATSATGPPKTINHNVMLGADNRPRVEFDADGEKMSPADFWQRWPKLKIDKITTQLKG